MKSKAQILTTTINCKYKNKIYDSESPDENYFYLCMKQPGYVECNNCLLTKEQVFDTIIVSIPQKEKKQCQKETIRV